MKTIKSIALLAGIALHAGLFAQNLTGNVHDNAGKAIAGAYVVWVGTQTATTTDADGLFSIPHIGGALAVNCIGYVGDTLNISEEITDINIILAEGIEIEKVDVRPESGTFKSHENVVNTDIITRFELGRAACCNLGESFSTNPSVDVNYSDAATGASQIKLLGLSGTYVQMMTESVPNFRGAAMPYSLGYIPGPWMQSIQVSKGAASVKNGYESVTGQINVEFKKPQARQGVSANLFMNSELRHEFNADASVSLSQKWSTGLFLHYDNSPQAHDKNNDGFADMPRTTQYNILNRWAYIGKRYIFQASLKALEEERHGGEIHTSNEHERYRIDIGTSRYEAFVKNALIIDEQKQRNVALILSGSLHDMDSEYGHKSYDVRQDNLYAQLMYESRYGQRHFISTGLSANYDFYDQRYTISESVRSREKDLTGGAYAQYTYTGQQLTLMLGVREDYDSRYGFFTTPRANIKYSPVNILTLRASAGKGYRTPHPLAENSFLLASNRQIIIDRDLEQEQAWNYGASALLSIPIANRDMKISAEYYYTDFRNQTVIDMDSNPHAVIFSNLSGKSYSHTFQAEISYAIISGLSVTAAYRVSDVKTTIGGYLRDKPLTSRYKGLFSVSYSTPLEKWQFDITMQFNGGGRMPIPYTTPDGELSWPERFKPFQLLNAQIKRNFRFWSIYVGAENITGFKQKNPIINASDPSSDGFDSSMIWGPTTGAVFYIGINFNWNKY